MTKITIHAASEDRVLNLKMSTIIGYLADGTLSGDLDAGLVNVASIKAYIEQRTVNRAKISIEEIKAALDTDRLTPDERDILQRRVDGETLREIARSYSISYEGVRLKGNRGVRRVLTSQG